MINTKTYKQSKHKQIAHLHLQDTAEDVGRSDADEGDHPTEEEHQRQQGGQLVGPPVWSGEEGEGGDDKMRMLGF